MAQQDIGKWTRVTGDARVALRTRVVQLYQSGLSIRAISGQTNRSYGAVYRLLGESGITLRPRGNPAIRAANDQANA